MEVASDGSELLVSSAFLLLLLVVLLLLLLLLKAGRLSTARFVVQKQT
jgi:hypothetical protein